MLVFIVGNLMVMRPDMNHLCHVRCLTRMDGGIIPIRRSDIAAHPHWHNSKCTPDFDPNAEVPVGQDRTAAGLRVPVPVSAAYCLSADADVSGEMT